MQFNVQNDKYLNYPVKNRSMFSVYVVLDFMFQPSPQRSLIGWT